jgi:hypothetical protein
LPRVVAGDVEPPRLQRRGIDARVVGQLLHHGGVRMRHVAQRAQVVGARELRDLLDERAEIGRRRLDAELLVIPRVGGRGRQRADGLPACR